MDKLARPIWWDARDNSWQYTPSETDRHDVPTSEPNAGNDARNHSESKIDESSASGPSQSGYSAHIQSAPIANDAGQRSTAHAWTETSTDEWPRQAPSLPADGGYLEPQVDSKRVGKDQRYRNGNATISQEPDASKLTESARTSGSAFFTKPHDKLNPDFWESDDDLLPEIRTKIIDDYLETFGEKYDDPGSWGTLWIVGSSTSYQYEEDDDLDAQLLVDLDAFQAANPDYAEVEWDDIRAEMHALTVAKIDGTNIIKDIPWQLFVRPEHDMEAWLAQASNLAQGVYDVEDDRWEIKPEKLPADFDPIKDNGPWVEEAKDVVQKGQDLIDHYADDPSQNAEDTLHDFYKTLREGRRDSFEGEGGQFGKGNFIWQYFVEFGSMHELKELVGGYTLSRQGASSWHLTDDPNFQLDPEYRPEANTTIGGENEPGLYLADHPDSWWHLHDYVRPYVAEVEHPNLPADTGYGRFLPAQEYGNANVKRVIPADQWWRETFNDSPLEGYDSLDDYIDAEKPTMHQVQCERCGWEGSGRETWNDGRCPACDTGKTHRTAAQQVYYHATWAKDAPQIEQQGLTGARNYLYDNMGAVEESYGYGMQKGDVALFEVNASDLPLQEDLDEYGRGAYFTEEPITPQRLRRISNRHEANASLFSYTCPHCGNTDKEQTEPAGGNGVRCKVCGKYDWDVDANGWREASGWDHDEDQHQSHDNGSSQTSRHRRDDNHEHDIEDKGTEGERSVFVSSSFSQDSSDPFQCSDPSCTKEHVESDRDAIRCEHCSRYTTHSPCDHCGQRTSAVDPRLFAYVCPGCGNTDTNQFVTRFGDLELQHEQPFAGNQNTEVHCKVCDQSHPLWSGKISASQVMYHGAPSSARDSIAQNGIDYRILHGEGEAPEGYGQRGNYLAEQPRWAIPANASGDIYEVDASGLNLRPDPAWEGGWYTQESIPSERVRYLRRYRDRSVSQAQSSTFSPISPPTLSLPSRTHSTYIPEWMKSASPTYYHEPSLLSPVCPHCGGPATFIGGVGNADGTMNHMYRCHDCGQPHTEVVPHGQQPKGMNPVTPYQAHSNAEDLLGVPIDIAIGVPYGSFHLPQREGTRRISTSDGEPWEWGHWGKGYIDPVDNSLALWNTTKDGDPHHMDMATEYGLIDPAEVEYTSGVPYAWPITIAPDGEYASAHWLNMGPHDDHPDLHRFENEVQELRYQPDGDKWAQKHWGHDDYGHAPKLGAEWWEDPDQADWQHGLCDTYALAMKEMYPHLRFGVLGHGDHFFTHDDNYAYDSLGQHGWEPHPDDDEGGYLRTFKPIPTDRFEAWTDPIDPKTWRTGSFHVSGPELYVHSTQHEFQPGDIVEPASKVGSDGWSDTGAGYDPNYIYMTHPDAFEPDLANPEGYFFPMVDDPGFRHYLVEPQGNVEPDPEAKALKGTEDEGWYHPYWHRAPQARVVRELDWQELANPDRWRTGSFHTAKSRSLYHGTLIDHLPSIELSGVVPQVGPFVQDAYGGEYENAGLSLEDEADPVSYWADKQNLNKSLTAIRHHVGEKLQKNFHDVTEDDVKNHGLLVKLPGQEGESTQEPPMNQLTEGNEGWEEVPIGVEPGDYYSQGFERGTPIHGAAMMRVFNQAGLLPMYNPLHTGKEG